MLVCTVTDCLFIFFCEECGLLDLVLDTLSESDVWLSLIVAKLCIVEFKKQSLHVGGI